MGVLNRTDPTADDQTPLPKRPLDKPVYLRLLSQLIIRQLSPR